MGGIIKMTMRTIKDSFGRYLAILLIVALSVGFYAGLNICEASMKNVCQNYVNEQVFYDFDVMSTLGFTKNDVKSMGELDGVKYSEGSKSVDVLIANGDESEASKFMSLPENINKISLVSGRMPEKDNECLADADYHDESSIGSTIEVTSDSDELKTDKFKIVGICKSPLYIGKDRGSTDIGSGSLNAFFYVKESAFDMDVYTAIYMKLDKDATIYSNEYDDLIESYKDKVTDKAEKLADARHDDLLQEVRDKVKSTVYSEVRRNVIANIPEMYRDMMTDAQINEMVTSAYNDAIGEATDKALNEADIPDAKVYVLTRAENLGFASFENDTSIITGIANVMPILFIFIALLVCITTTSRMVDEERTQIGVLKAMGFGNRAISMKYALYMGSATFFGWIIGFFPGTYGLPQIFWKAYGAIYDFAPMKYLFSPILAVLTLVVAMVCIVGAALICCKGELGSEPAALIRPKTPKIGKRILLERIGVFWNRLSFLHKVTLRNLFRYKERLVMMVIGVGCCGAFVLLAFGVRDSMINIDSLQYDEIQTYNLQVTYDESNDRNNAREIILDEAKDAYVIDAGVYRVDVKNEEATINNVSIQAFRSEDKEALKSYWDLVDAESGEALGFPDENEAFVTKKIASKLKLNVGDTISLEDSEGNKYSIKVGGIYRNYLQNYVIMSENTAKSLSEDYKLNSFLIKYDKADDIAENLMKSDSITAIDKISTIRNSIANALSCLNYIIWLIVIFAGALAFIVMYNLTNINLAERRREIATVEVLGFYPKETESYILRENLLMSIIAGIVGLPIGVVFHRFVMSRILIDTMTYPVIIKPVSYLISFVCTIIFALIVNLFMKRHIRKIDMAESLKAVE